jgi:hypothetical protein
MKNPFQELFPELGWTKFDNAERQRLLQNLETFSAHGPQAADYIRAHGTQFGYFPQTKSSAGWTLSNNLTLRPGADLDAPATLAVIIHEVLHLQQSLTMRLSIQGELIAWQYQYQVYFDATGKHFGETGQPFDGSKTQWEQLSQLSTDSRQDLATAQRLMKEISPVYRAHLLPLYPVGREVRHLLRNAKR